MTTAARIGALVLVGVLAGCGVGQGKHLRAVTPAPLPEGIPKTWDFSDPQALPQHRNTAMAACAWYLDVAPATADSKDWIRARDYALDWIEAMREPALPVTQPIVAYIATDRRFMYGAYMRGAYQCAKAEYLLRMHDADIATRPDAFAAELAGIEGMHRLFRAIQAWDPKAYSKRLRKYARKHKRGKLEAFLVKVMGRKPPRQRR
ncbi:MAG: hypothetical protein K1X88_02175 [Nannocystaceae bacterium]|nr:hypothetical protein [Nannocystaceae bacterium]